jgi:hypothetical protein
MRITLSGPQPNDPNSKLLFEKGNNNINRTLVISDLCSNIMLRASRDIKDAHGLLDHFCSDPSCLGSCSLII